MFYRFSFGIVVCILVAFTFWIFRLLKVIYNIFKYTEIRSFYNNALKITSVSIDLSLSYGEGRGWSWSYGSWIYSYLCNQCLSPLKLWVRIPLMARCTQYNIMWYGFLSDLRQVGGFLWILRFPPLIKLTATIYR